MSGAPYHPQTNGAAERLVQTFKQSLRNGAKAPKAALQEFLMQYRRMPIIEGCYSPSELLNGRQIRTKIDVLLPSASQLAQRAQEKVTRRQERSRQVRTKKFGAGDACYALYCGPKRTKEAKWIPAIIVKKFGARSYNVRVVPRGPTWRRHSDQLTLRWDPEEDANPGDDPESNTERNVTSVPARKPVTSSPRRSKRTRKPVIRYSP